MTESIKPKEEVMPDLALWEFHPGDHVRYVPYHAYGDRKHKDCENGRVTSTNEHYVFVRFRGETSRACKADQLVKL